MEDFYGGWTGPLEKFYLFIYFLFMISDEDFYGGRTGPLEKFYTEHCSVGPTKLIETIASTTTATTTTARMKI